MPTLPQSARRHYLWSAGLVEHAVRESHKLTGLAAIARLIGQHQIVAATQAERAIAAMLGEQDIDEPAGARLLVTAFTTGLDRTKAILEQATVDTEFDRIVAGLVADSGRAAESVAVAVRPHVGYVRYLNPPSCSRCAVLAGRVYRYSSGFLRHPGCDCVMVPTTVANTAFTQDPVDLVERGLVTGLSKADAKAVADGADFNLIVNTKSKSAGLSIPGRAVARGGRPTPEAIYADATSRDDAIERLIAAGYVR